MDSYEILLAPTPSFYIPSPSLQATYLYLCTYLPTDDLPRFPAISVNVSREYVSLRDAGWMDRTHLKAQREVNWLSSTSPLTIKLLPPSRTYLLMRWRVIWHPGRWTRPAEVPRLSSAVAVCRRCDQLYRGGWWIWRHGAHDHGAVVVVHEKWEWQGVRAQDRTAIHHHLCYGYGAIFGACRKRSQAVPRL